MAQPVGDLVVSLDVDAAKFNEQVSYVRKQFTGLGADSTKAGTQVQQAFSKQELAAQRAGISIGQYKQAMRMLPAQFTDIATQLAGGQSPWLILLQQGGQIKDSFGGVGNVAKILLTYITPLNAAIGVAAAVFGSLGLAVYKSQQEIAEASKIIQESLGLSGGAAEKLAQNIRAIADSSGASIKSVADLFITTKDGADEATRKMIAVGFSYLDAKAKVSEYKDSSDFTNLNTQIEAHRLKVLGIPDAWTDAEEAVRNYYSGVNLGKQSAALGGAIDPIVGVLEQAKQLRGDLTKATTDGNLATQKSVEWINKEYLATDAVAGAEAKLKEAREQSRKIAFSGDATAIANAQKLIALREKEVEQAKKRLEPKKQRVTTSAGDRAEDSAQGDLLSLQAQLKVL
ncbi:UNVERIFIED_ORG: vacuolar-type H+-ATPase subunit H, partial [Rahnella aquatilis]|nr:vacuolar-type H+-ATPase subunit H [Rahnella aquatilis]